MEPFNTHAGKLAVLPHADVDTDQIIPARFLSMVTRSGYGELLFKDLRSSEFPLDQPAAVGATVLVTMENFGCGSSREHAVWAIQQAGFKAVIARKTETAAGFSDIFRMNSENNGLLLIELEDADHKRMIEQGSGAEVVIDLEQQLIQIASGNQIRFEINPATKQALLNGLDLIGASLLFTDAIAHYETTRGPWIPPKA